MATSWSHVESATRGPLGSFRRHCSNAARSAGVALRSRMEARIGDLERANAGLRQENAVLRAENADLRARLGQDSSNSSKPVCHEREGGVRV